MLRIGRWPRRIAALACLLLAAASALPRHAPAQPPHRLHAGQVAVPIAVQSAADVDAGDHVGVLVASSSATVIDDRLRVLAVHPAESGLAAEATAVITVATDRAHAVVLARYAGRALMLISDDFP